MATTAAARSRFFLHMALGFLAIAVVGFSSTFLIPLARGTFSAPPVIHVHGALLFGWLLFFILQSSLIQKDAVSSPTASSALPARPRASNSPRRWPSPTLFSSGGISA